MMSAWIRHYFHADPYTLTTREFARLWREAEYLLTVTKPYKKDE
jgi:hypothetical protein